jgi:hypothetical protein
MMKKEMMMEATNLPEEQFKAFLLKYQVKWPSEMVFVSDKEQQVETIGMHASETPTPLHRFVETVIYHAGLTSDENLRTAVLVARMTRPMGIFYWLLRFVYESRGHTFDDVA